MSDVEGVAQCLARSNETCREMPRCCGTVVLCSS